LYILSWKQTLFSSSHLVASSRGKAKNSGSVSSLFCLQIILVTELRDRGHDVTLFNRGKTPPKQIPGESDADFAARKEQTKYLKGDRTDPEQLKGLIDPSMYSCERIVDLRAHLSPRFSSPCVSNLLLARKSSFHFFSETHDGLSVSDVYDMNGREKTDTAPLADIFNSPKSALKVSACIQKRRVSAREFSNRHLNPSLHCRTHSCDAETSTMLAFFLPASDARRKYRSCLLHGYFNDFGRVMTIDFRRLSCT
jgi:hypothetical protein